MTVALVARMDNTTHLHKGRVTCSWCRKVLVPAKDPSVLTSHGICPEHTDVDASLLVNSWKETQRLHEAFRGEQ